MSDNSDPITIPHQPGKLDFQIVEKEVSVTQFRRKPSAVWAYLETAGHVIIFTRRGKRDRDVYKRQMKMSRRWASSVDITRRAPFCPSRQMPK